MAETFKPDLSYVCPNCGQQALVGTHFCRTIPREEPEQPPRRRGGSGGNRGLFLLLAGALLVLLLWRLVGPASLVLLAIGFLGFRLWSALTRGNGAAYRELVRICKTTDTADRLVAAERQRNPQLSVREAEKQALARYRRDLGR